MAARILIADAEPLPEAWKPRTAEEADADWARLVDAGILRRDHEVPAPPLADEVFEADPLLREPSQTPWSGHSGQWS